MVRPELRPMLDILDSAAICDAARRLGLAPRFMDAGIRPVWPGARTVGPAYTVRIIPGQGGCGDAIDAARPGDVLVIDARGRTDAIVWGELFSGRAGRRGIAGAVVDGAVRDLEGVAELAFALFARAVVPGTAPWGGDGTLRVPVTVGRVRVRPGDIIFADEMGVVAVAAEAWEEVAAEAERIQRREGERFAEHLRALRTRRRPPTMEV